MKITQKKLATAIELNRHPNTNGQGFHSVVIPR